MKLVAYINVEERKLEWAKPTAWETPTIAKMDKVPLYTHPADLTDEEIMELIPSSDSYDTYLSKEDFVDFARAILKKAGEK